MIDLYHRLEELEEVMRILAGDVARLAEIIRGQSSDVEPSNELAGKRRAYVRAVFALFEAIVEQNKRLLLDLAVSNKVALNTEIIGALSEQFFMVEENGRVNPRKQYIHIRRKIRAIHRAAEEAFGEPIIVKFDDSGWDSFRNALRIRDRLTHPKSPDDCSVEDEDVSMVHEAGKWFRELNNAFVKVATRHRMKNNW